MGELPFESYTELKEIMRTTHVTDEPARGHPFDMHSIISVIGVCPEGWDAPTQPLFRHERCSHSDVVSVWGQSELLIRAKHQFLTRIELTRKDSQVWNADEDEIELQIGGTSICTLFGPDSHNGLYRSLDWVHIAPWYDVSVSGETLIVDMLRNPIPFISLAYHSVTLWFRRPALRQNITVSLHTFDIVQARHRRRYLFDSPIAPHIRTRVGMLADSPMWLSVPKFIEKEWTATRNEFKEPDGERNFVEWVETHRLNRIKDMIAKASTPEYKQLLEDAYTTLSMYISLCSS